MGKIDSERERQRLVQHYSAMSDLELKKAGRDPAGLTEIAFAALQEEMDRRELNWPGKATSWALLHPTITIESENPAQDEFTTVPSPTFTSGSNREHGAPVVVRKFRDIPEALTAKVSLESAGIECALFDETFIRMDWFCSSALGGVKLLVRKSDADEAKKILDEKTPEQFEGEGIGVYEQPRCPLCGSLDVSWKELRRKIAFTCLLFFNLPVTMNEKGWHCHACNHRWRREDDGG